MVQLPEFVIANGRRSRSFVLAASLWTVTKSSIRPLIR